MISIASTPTSFTVFFSTAVAMPQPQNDVAIKWEVEAPYLATSKDHIKAAILTDNDLWRCMGSSRYQICFHMKVAETGDRLCFASLNFEANTAALRICDTEKVQLPSIENAKNRICWLAPYIINNCLQAFWIRHRVNHISKKYTTQVVESASLHFMAVNNSPDPTSKYTRTSVLSRSYQLWKSMWNFLTPWTIFGLSFLN